MKKIFFIHIAKTAGSAFNIFLKKNFTGEEHCERYLISGTNELSKIEHLKRLDYLSGHLNFSVFQYNNFSKENYFLMAFLREPITQLISHLNWVIHIKDISDNFFEGHPDNIKQMCLELREANLYNTDIFIEKLNKFQGLFKNNQSRYFINHPHELSTEFVLNNMMLLDMVGITEKYQNSMEKFIMLNNLKINPIVEIVNKNPFYKIERDLLENKVIYDFLLEYQAIDMEVYRHFLEK